MAFKVQGLPGRGLPRNALFSFRRPTVGSAGVSWTRGHRLICSMPACAGGVVKIARETRTFSGLERVQSAANSEAVNQDYIQQCKGSVLPALRRRAPGVYRFVSQRMKYQTYRPARGAVAPAC